MPGGTGNGPAPGSSSSGPATVNVTVNNAVQFASGSFDSVASAVKSGIQAGADAATQVASDAATAVTKAVGDLTTGIGNGVNALFDGLQSALKYIGNLVLSTVKSLVQSLTSDIGSALRKIGDIVTSINNDILKPLSNVITSIKTTLDTTIVPIFQTISQVYNQTVALIGAIKDDVSNGIKGLLQLPSDISNSLGSIDAAIQRGVSQIGLTKKDGTSVLIGKGGSDTAWDRLSDIGKGIGILGNVNVETITYADLVRLSEPDLARAGAANIGALVGEITDFVRAIGAGRTSIGDAFKSALPLGLPLLGAEVGTWIGAWELFKSIEELFEPFYEFAKDEIKAKSGLAKLPVGQVLEAWRRGIVTDKDLAEDLAVNGWDSGRIAVMKDLQEFLIDIDTSIDMLHRGIITDEELNNSLRKHGVSGTQMAALKEASVRLSDVGIAAEAYRRKLIDGDALDAVLRQNRYADNERTLYKATMLQPETVADVLGRLRFERLYSTLGFVDPAFGDVPSPVLDAATRDALDSQVAKDRWQAAFFVPQLQTWLELYYRGVRTSRELEAAMDYYRVPKELRDDLIITHRPLIPFRTIPTMLAAGIISEPYAKQQLQGHGFDLQATEALLAYASIHKTTAKASNASALKSLSVASARSFWEQGALTESQYREVLAAHGETQDAIDVTVKVETLAAAAKERKQEGQDIVNEVLAGIISVDQAMQQFKAQSFTQAEQARYLKQIAKVQRATSKTPGEAELLKMVKAGVIDQSTYEDALGVLGYARKWIDAIVALHSGGASGSTGQPQVA